MTRIIGIDYGMAKTGISLSDPLKIIASDYDVIFEKDIERKFEVIKDIIKNNNVEKIVIGLPLNMDGSHGFQADLVKEFGELLSELNIPIIYIDERMSTKKAEDTMKMLNFSEAEIRKKSDARAASIILQEYLDYS